MCKIKVIGCGGSGTCVLNSLLKKEKSNDEQVEIYLVNSDAGSLKKSDVNNKLLIGDTGLGCGGDTQKAKQYLEQANDKIKNILKDTDLLILTTGMGGGTGTAAVCEIAKTAKEQNIFTVAVVSMPFTAEGLLRITVAENGLKELKEYTKAVFFTESDKIFSYIGDTASWTVNFGVIDSVTAEAINSIITTIVNNNAGAGIDICDLEYMAENSKQITLKRGVGSTIEEAFNNATANNIYGKFDISKAERIFLTTVYDKNAAIIPDIKYLNDEIKNKFSNYKSCKIQTLQQSNRNYIQIIMILSF